MMNRIALLVSLSTILLLPAGCSPAPGSKTTIGPASFSDGRIEIEVPGGATLESAAGEDTHTMTIDGDTFYLSLGGAAESDDLGRKRTEASRAEVASREVTPAAAGSGAVTITDVSPVQRHDINGETVFVFSFSANTESGGVVETEHATMGFGSVGGSSILFRHTSSVADTQSAKLVEFLKAIAFKRG